MVGPRPATRGLPPTFMVGRANRCVCIAGVPALWLCSLLLVVHCGCSGFTKRFQRNDVVSARQIARQGADAVHAGDWERAEQYYSKAVEVCPVDERVRARYAEALWNCGLHTEGIKHQVEAVRLSGDAPDLTIRLGEMYLAQGDLVQAQKLAQRVIDSGRESATAYRLRGDVLERQGNWRDALADYHRALSIQPEYPEVQMAVAQVYQRNGRPQRALATLQSLSTAYPPSEEPTELLYWHGMAFASLGRHRQAIERFTIAESRGLQSADLQFRLAESYHFAGNHVAASLALERAMQLDPNHPHASRLCESIQPGHRLARVPD